MLTLADVDFAIAYLDILIASRKEAESRLLRDFAAKGIGKRIESLFAERRAARLLETVRVLLVRYRLHFEIRQNRVLSIGSMWRRMARLAEEVS